MDAADPCRDRHADVDPLRAESRLAVALCVCVHRGGRRGAGDSTNRLVIHPEADEEDMKKFSNILGVKIEHSTVNNGIPYVSSGILANNNCIVVGTMTSGPEIMMMTRAFLN